MYTANIVDTVIFRTVGKHPSPHLQSLKRAVERAGTELWVPAAIYRELADYGGGESTVNPYLDAAIEDGWVRVATPLPGDRSDGFESVDDPVERAQHLADGFLSQQSKYPVANNWQDASLVALAVRMFEHDTRIRVITADTARKPIGFSRGRKRVRSAKEPTEHSIADSRSLFKIINKEWILL